jgi:hypothetical protein
MMKPLGHRSYGSIPHLPGSRRGPSDRGCNEGQYKICCEKARDKHDRIIVQEKLDGSNVAIANINGELVALSRAGWLARTSPFKLHHLFADWVDTNIKLFDFLPIGSRVCGEWLALAHGTIYKLSHGPFVAFDIMTGMNRMPHESFRETVGERIPTVTTIHNDGPLAIGNAMALLGQSGFHGCSDGLPEGVVYRVERNGRVDFLAKYVRPDKQDGKYLPELCGTETWLWRPNERS